MKQFTIATTVVSASSRQAAWLWPLRPRASQPAAPTPPTPLRPCATWDITRSSTDTGERSAGPVHRDRRARAGQRRDLDGVHHRLRRHLLPGRVTTSAAHR